MAVLWFGVVYDGGAGVVKVRGEGAADGLAGMKSLRQGRVHRQE